MLVISAFTVESTPRGFNRCTWPATSLQQAEQLAKELSLEKADNPTYPNAFWVVGPKGESLGKYYRGQRFERFQPC